MRKIILVALMGLTSAVAFANDNGRDGDRGGQDNGDNQYSCFFRGERGLRCSAFVKLDDGRRDDHGRPIVDENGRDRGDSLLAIECNNHFDFKDRNAKSEQDHKSFVIFGEDDGFKAIIKAGSAPADSESLLNRDDRHRDRQDHDRGGRDDNDQEGRRHGDKLRAELIIKRDRDVSAMSERDHGFELDGFCRKHNDGQDLSQFLF